MTKNSPIYCQRDYKSTGTQTDANRKTQSNEQSRPYPRQVSLGYRHWGNFSQSATRISLSGNAMHLTASCTCEDGHSSLVSSISLDSLLTNDDGRFVWQQDGLFGLSAQNIRLVCELGDDEFAPWIEDYGHRPLLEAELRKIDGTWVKDYVWLDERIANSNGSLTSTIA